MVYGIGNWVLKHCAKPLSLPYSKYLISHLKQVYFLVTGNKQMYVQCLRKTINQTKQITVQSRC